MFLTPTGSVPAAFKQDEKCNNRPGALQRKPGGGRAFACFTGLIGALCLGDPRDWGVGVGGLMGSYLPHEYSSGLRAAISDLEANIPLKEHNNVWGIIMLAERPCKRDSYS